MSATGLPTPAAAPRGFARVLAHTDLLAAVAVVTIVTMLVVPLPPTLLDLLITLNISGGLVIVVVTMYVNKALEFSVFPSLLLLTTMFRLAINVSVTRRILSTGNAGSVVHAFGQFVVGNNVLIGLIIFLILVVIQFVVITNGAGRVAEVSARFTLDAMPGKQMAIDADMNAGLITDQEARARRQEITREADFYGSMDGASKFVRGDAMAAVLITLINLIGGIVMGVLIHHDSFGTAIHTYSMLTVGDGLAAQIPALLISVATGILVTRSASQRDLGSEIAGQILSQQRAPIVAGAAICAFAMVPGLPKIPFLLIGVMLIFVGRYVTKHGVPESLLAVSPAAGPATPGIAPPAAGALGDGVARETVLKELAIDALELSVGFGLVPLVDRGAGGTLAGRVSLIRRQIATEMGMVIPRVRIHDELDLEAHEYEFKVRGVAVARGKVLPGHLLAMDPGDVVGSVDGIPTVEPAFGMAALWIHEGQRPAAEAAGYTVVDGESVIVTHLTETIRGHAAELLTRQDVRQLLDQLKTTNEAVVNEVVPDILSLGEIQRVLQCLLGEGVSIRDLSTIVEAVSDKARLTRDPVLLAEYARQALGRSITAPYLGVDQTLHAITLDPAVEAEVVAALTQTTEGELLAMEPARAQAMLTALRQQAEQANARLGARPVLLCSARVRRHIRRLVEHALPHLAVCSYNEIAAGVSVETIGVVHT
ncbi:flagellar biosynthesis protein FlhA [Conexibacter sp. DBS9H8]|uniref:flagellar biosynthesis protein FlhA n=1 Tax=Conexibacter sp. DBS9H8 TaxID=2937801 RepID=UPI0020106A36|nr:flagellar biosynthesis protein FlhA [Conexibacter sp. DBS9H8]